MREAIARGAVGFDAVKHLVLCRIERRPPRLDMTIYPYLPKATVATTSARSYMDLLVTSNLPFDEWTSVFGSERIIGALLNRLTHHVHILEMNGDSFRLAHSKRRSRRARSEPPSDTAPQE